MTKTSDSEPSSQWKRDLPDIFERRAIRRCADLSPTARMVVETIRELESLRGGCYLGRKAQAGICNVSLGAFDKAVARATEIGWLTSAPGPLPGTVRRSVRVPQEAVDAAREASESAFIAADVAPDPSPVQATPLSSTGEPPPPYRQTPSPVQANKGNNRITTTSPPDSARSVEAEISEMHAQWPDAPLAEAREHCGITPTAAQWCSFLRTLPQYGPDVVTEKSRAFIASDGTDKGWRYLAGMMRNGSKPSRRKPGRQRFDAGIGTAESFAALAAQPKGRVRL